MTTIKPRRNKYGAKKIERKPGLWFASKLESAVYDILLLREKAGEISEIKCQDTVYLTDARIIYKPDFRFLNNETGNLEWSEAKGLELQAWRIKRKLWMYYGPGNLLVYMGSWQRPFLKETIEVK